MSDLLFLSEICNSVLCLCRSDVSVEYFFIAAVLRHTTSRVLVHDSRRLLWNDEGSN